MSYSLVRLRPSPALISTSKGGSTSKRKRPKRRHKKTTLSQWLYLYLPLVAVGLVLCYFLAELLLKVMMVRTVRDEWKALPVDVEQLPVAPMVPRSSPPSVKRDEPAPTPQAIPHAEAPRTKQLPVMQINTTRDDDMRSIQSSFEFIAPSLA